MLECLWQIIKLGLLQVGYDLQSPALVAGHEPWPYSAHRGKQATRLKSRWPLAFGAIDQGSRRVSDPLLLAAHQAEAQACLHKAGLG